MPSLILFQLLTCLSVLVYQVAAVCQSSGTDFMDQGGPYCINITSSDYFSFGTVFSGCATSDAQNGEITPILVDPNTDEYFCSDIPVVPNGVTEVSTCNVAGNVVRKNQMFSGTWTVVIEGLTFAYQRSFSIIAALPVTVTSTPVATFVSTQTPTVTVTATNIQTITSTLPPRTTTVPSSTRTATRTIIPLPVITQVTSVATLTIFKAAFATTVLTKTSTIPCVVPAVLDRKLTFSLTKTPKALATKAASKRGNGRERAVEAAVEAQVQARDLNDLRPRTPDLCTTTVLATTNLPSTTVTVTGPTSTFTTTTDRTTTATITPPPVTAFSGVASTTITVTLPALTLTNINRSITQITVTNTLFATLTSTTTVRAPGC